MFLFFKKQSKQFILTLKKYHNWLERTNTTLFSIASWPVLFVSKLSIALLLLVLQVPDTYLSDSLVSDDYKVSLDLLLKALVFAPIIETFIFQYLFFQIYDNFRINKWVIITISAFAFGATHYYSLHYIIETSFMGFVFMYLYVLRAENNKNAFGSIWGAHFFYNFMATLFILITHYIKFGTVQ